MSAPTPAEIAAKLTKAQREAMGWIARGDGSPPGWGIALAIHSLFDLGLHEFGHFTPLGLLVRAELEKEKRDD